jgi:uncharacterized protein DUF6114
VDGPRYDQNQPTGWPVQPGPAGRHAGADQPLPAVPTGGSRRRGRWRHWRRSRPFWGGLLVLLGGGWILLTEHPPLRMVIHLGMQGFAGLALPIVMVLCGLLLWFNPAQRLFYSILAVLLSLGTWITSNLGGFLIGMLLGIIGGSLAFGWTLPRATPAVPPPTQVPDA